MDEILISALNKAADKIRAGNLDDARELLREILTRNYQIEQAWFLISYTLPELEKRKFALQKALEINPEFDKAKSRLEKVQKNILLVEESENIEPSEQEKVYEDQKQWDVSAKTEPLPELPEEPEDNEQEENSETSAPFYESDLSNIEEESTESEKENEEESEQTESNKDTKTMRRRLVLAFFAVILIAALYLFAQSIDLFSGIFGQNTNSSTSTLSQGFRTLPPTWTPVTSLATQTPPTP